MPQPNAVVRDGLIVHEDGDGQASALVGSAPWFAWLALATSTSFRVQDGPAPYTARREAQRGRWYWSAYRRQASRLRKLYLGRAETLTYARLLEIGERFAQLQASKPQPLATHAERRTFAALLSSEAASLLGREADTAGARAANPPSHAQGPPRRAVALPRQSSGSAQVHHPSPPRHPPCRVQTPCPRSWLPTPETQALPACAPFPCPTGSG